MGMGVERNAKTDAREERGTEEQKRIAAVLRIWRDEDRTRREGMKVIRHRCRALGVRRGRGPTPMAP